MLAWCVDQQFLYSYKAKINKWSWQEISRISAEDQYGKISSLTVKVGDLINNDISGGQFVHL